jgi:hypothetical protein
MTLKDMLKKKDKIRDEGATNVEAPPMLSPDVPEFSFLRTTTTTQEAIEPPSFAGDPVRPSAPLVSPPPQRGLAGRFRRHSNAASSLAPGENPQAKPERRLSQRIHFGRSRSTTSTNVPEDLPEITGDGVARNEEEEAKWEKRATILVASSSALKSPPPTPSITVEAATSGNSPSSRLTQQRSRSATVGNAPDDVRIVTGWTKVSLRGVLRSEANGCI